MRDLWLLPPGMEDLVAVDAERLERLRRVLIDHYHCRGYDLVFPPMVEHLDSLLEPGGEDLEIETFKLIDHASGRQLGVRADMTPQIARIDAHVLKRTGPARLCYAGPVLRARTRQDFESREQFQVGAELYGSYSARADVEIVDLMMDSVSLCGLARPQLDIGHVGIFRALARKAGVDAAAEAELFDALQRKSVPDLEAIVGALSLPAPIGDALVALPGLHGPVAELDAALEHVCRVGPETSEAVANLREVVGALQGGRGCFDIYFDLSELRGYHYHTGVVFAALVAGHGREIARGGRYDDAGAVFGRARAATGFSLDLRQLIRLAGTDQAPANGCIFAPAQGRGLDEAVRRLREQGERVVCALDEGGDRPPPCCDRRLVVDGASWRVEPIATTGGANTSSR